MIVKKRFLHKWTAIFLAFSLLGFAGCGGSDSTVGVTPSNLFVDELLPDDVTPNPSVQVTIGRVSRLLRMNPSGQALFPEISISPTGVVPTVVFKVESGDEARLLDPGAGPQHTSVLSSDGKTLTLVFSGSTGQEISEFIRGNVKAVPTGTIGELTAFRVEVSDSEGRLFFSDREVLSIAAVGALSFNYSVDGGLVNDDTGEVLAGSSPQTAILTIAGSSIDARGSILKFEPGNYGGGSEPLLSVPSNFNLRSFQIEGPDRNGGARSEGAELPAVLKASGPLTVSRGIIELDSPNGVFINGLDFEIGGTGDQNVLRAAVRISNSAGAPTDTTAAGAGIFSCRFVSEDDLTTVGIDSNAGGGGIVYLNGNYVRGCSRGASFFGPSFCFSNVFEQNRTAVHYGTNSGLQSLFGNALALGTQSSPSITIEVSGTAGISSGPVQVGLLANDFYDFIRIWSGSSLLGNAFTFGITDIGSPNFVAGTETVQFPATFRGNANLVGPGDVNIESGSISSDPSKKNLPDYVP